MDECIFFYRFLINGILHIDRQINCEIANSLLVLMINKYTSLIIALHDICVKCDKFIIKFECVRSFKVIKLKYLTSDVFKKRGGGNPSTLEECMNRFSFGTISKTVH